MAALKDQDLHLWSWEWHESILSVKQDLRPITECSGWERKFWSAYLFEKTLCGLFLDTGRTLLRTASRSYTIRIGDICKDSFTYLPGPKKFMCTFGEVLNVLKKYELSFPIGQPQLETGFDTYNATSTANMRYNEGQLKDDGPRSETIDEASHAVLRRRIQELEKQLEESTDQRYERNWQLEVLEETLEAQTQELERCQGRNQELEAQLEACNHQINHYDQRLDLCGQEIQSLRFDSADLGIVVAKASNIAHGDKIGVLERLPSKYLSRHLVERLVNVPTFQRKFLTIRKPRRAISDSASGANVKHEVEETETEAQAITAIPTVKRRKIG